MKLMASGVIFSAAMVRSPSFFTVLVVHQDNHASLTNFFDRFFDRCEIGFIVRHNIKNITEPGPGVGMRRYKFGPLYRTDSRAF